MKFLFDPVWPWSELPDLLGRTDTLTRLFIALVCGCILALPFLLCRPGAEPRRVLRRMAWVLGGAFLVLLWWRWQGQTTGGGLFTELAASLLLIIPVVLIALTVGSYLGVPGASPRRITGIVLLRLLAFLLALVAVFRPYLALPSPESKRGVILILVDASESMGTTDEVNGQSRWDTLLATLRSNDDLLDILRDNYGIDFVFQAFGAELRDFALDSPGKADGQRSEIGANLQRLYETRDAGRQVLAVLLLSDGGDTGPVDLAVGAAARWRNLPCPVHTFVFGKASTDSRHHDVAITAVQPSPSPVPIKSDLSVKVTIDQFGFDGRTVRVRLFIEDEEVKAQDVKLDRVIGNEVELKTLAPAQPGEVKLRVRVEDTNPNRQGLPLQGEVNEKNNEKTTFLNVTREGFSVLLVDKNRGMEPQRIHDVLRQDAGRMSVRFVSLRDAGAEAAASDLFQFERRQYDVVLLGDVTPQQLRAANPKALSEIEKIVARGGGLLFSGGYGSFGPAWSATELTPLFPVEVGSAEQIDGAVKMKPTPDGLRDFAYILRLGSRIEDAETEWGKLIELNGANRLTLPKELGLIKVLATSSSRTKVEPLLVSREYGKGRVLAFAGDTTNLWIRSPETRQLHAQFWRQLVMWLAHQDQAEGSIWVKPDTRSIPLRSDLGFTVGLKSKNGVEVTNANFRVKVIGPDQAAREGTEVHTRREAEGQRGTFQAKEPGGGWRKAGVYRIEVSGEGKGPDGETIRGTESARFVIEDEDVEKAHQAADPKYLSNLAAAGGGKAYRPEDLGRVLKELQERSESRVKQMLRPLPDWQTRGKSPFPVVFLGLFAAVLTTEWVLRRIWGLA
jgi:uncharacterized membrane protein